MSDAATNYLGRKGEGQRPSDAPQWEICLNDIIDNNPCSGQLAPEAFRTVRPCTCYPPISLTQENPTELWFKQEKHFSFLSAF